MPLSPLEARAGAIEPYVPGHAQPLPLYLARVEAGFPSPADDHVDRVLDLNELCVEHPAATFFIRVAGESMTGAGIHEGDVLVVDRALEPKHGDVVIAALDGEHLVKRLHVLGRNGSRRVFLVADHPDYPPIEVLDGHALCLWGVVTHVVHRLR